jgi:hypothetical protein
MYSRDAFYPTSAKKEKKEKKTHTRKVAEYYHQRIVVHLLGLAMISA